MDIQDSSLLFVERVPEHSLPLMTAMSGGEAFRIGNYLFFASQEWLMAIAYSLDGRQNPGQFEEALAQALQKTGASDCYAIGPTLPARLTANIVDRDRYYVLGCKAAIPSRLRNPVNKAKEILLVREGSSFTAAHRRLWAEFLALRGDPRQMPDRVAQLYARTPTALQNGQGNLRLLDAIDKNGNIVASLLLDYAPQNFTSYILGAHSRKYYVPHAADLLFAAMLEKSRQAGKRYIHLGLGVNDGILRFKRKWGAVPALPYVMAQWQEAAKPAENVNLGRVLATALVSSGSGSGRKMLETPIRRPFAMLWRVQKNGKTSWLAGTAHFFCYSFEPSFRKLFKRVDNVIFEGPLDAEFMAAVDRVGKTRPPGMKNLLEQMTEAEIENLERTVLGPRGKLARSLNICANAHIDVRWYLANTRYWCAFFTLWTTFLERMGWHESVDMEAWRTAKDMGKNVLGMENLEEQLESLGSLPPERVLRFFRNCGNWKSYSRRNIRAYLAGDLEGMMGSSAEFPTRTEHIVGRRDQRFRERMRPWLEKGDTAVFVGTAHLVNLRHMLEEDGFTVQQAPFGLWPKIHYRWRQTVRPDGKVTW